MKLLLDKIRRLDIGWNERLLTEADFHMLCERFGVIVDETELKVSGFYFCGLGKHYIAVNRDLPPDKKLFTMFHEFGHFLVHSPRTDPVAGFCGVRHSRVEAEADMFALVALMPKQSIAGRTAEELIEHDGLDAIRVRQRLELLAKRKF